MLSQKSYNELKTYGKSKPIFPGDFEKYTFVKILFFYSWVDVECHYKIMLDGHMSDGQNAIKNSKQEFLKTIARDR